jgi:ABC-2 type transport system ATP-binding protein
MPHAIDVRNLSKTFHPRRGFARWLSASPISHDLKVLEDLTFHLQRGEIFGLLGPNGAGKSTLLRILATLMHPTVGEARLLGYDTVRDEARVRERVGLVLGDERSFYWRLTGRENLRFFGALYNLRGGVRDRRIDEVAALLSMEAYLDQRYDAYSTGMRQKLSLARGLLGDAEVLLLDEPTRGLDPAASESLLCAIRALSRDAGVTILMVTHRMTEAKAVCDSIGVLRNGRLRTGRELETIGRSAGSTRRYTFYAQPDARQAEKPLGGLTFTSAVECDAKTISVTVEEPAQHLAEVLELLGREGVRIEHIESNGAPIQELFGPDVRREVG